MRIRKWKLNKIEYGFQLTDESTITVLMSSGQNFKTRILIIYTGPDFDGDVWFDGDCQTSNKEVTNTINKAIEKGAKKERWINVPVDFLTEKELTKAIGFSFE